MYNIDYNHFNINLWVMFCDNLSIEAALSSCHIKKNIEIREYYILSIIHTYVIKLAATICCKQNIFHPSTVLCPILYLLFTYDIAEIINIQTATFVDEAIEKL